VQRHDEEKRVVVLTPEDVKNVEDFFTHFKLQPPELMRIMLEKFRKDPKAVTFDDQKLFRAAIAMSMTSIDHPLVKDQAFVSIRTKCDKAYFDAQFDMDIEKALREPKTTETKSSEG
jgi:hypothetical protein